MGWTREPKELARRLSICAECPHIMLTIFGQCQSCKRRGAVSGKDDSDLSCKHCGGEMEGREILRCGSCGCPLATRKFASCPIGKW